MHTVTYTSEILNIAIIANVEICVWENKDRTTVRDVNRYDFIRLVNVLWTFTCYGFTL